MKLFVLTQNYHYRLHLACTIQYFSSQEYASQVLIPWACYIVKLPCFQEGDDGKKDPVELEKKEKL